MREFPYKNNDPVVPFTVVGERSAVATEGYADTGAGTVVVPESIGEQAGLVWLGSASILTVGGILPENVYLGKIQFLGREFDVTVICRNLPQKEALLGRDVLDHFEACFDGRRKVLRFHV